MRVVLVVTGSIAAIKMPDLIGKLRAKDVEVTCVLTQGGSQFVAKEELEKLSDNTVFDDLWEGDDDQMHHIRLSRENDLIAVVPGSADFMAKMVHGLANDLASALILASDKPVLIAPAMNVKMWEHPATKRNVAQLKADGVAFVGPSSGALACGEAGEGRMAEPDEVSAAIIDFLEGAGDRRSAPLKGTRILITSGPTVEAIDPVRFISNRSSGKQGHAIAESLVSLGADVTLVSGPTALPDPIGAKVVHVQSAKDMYEACQEALPVDVAICAAAVADWGVAEVAQQKIKKSGNKEDFTLTFAENVDILAWLSRHKTRRPKLVVGFAAESEHVMEHARVKLERKGCDWIVANDVQGGAVFDSDENTVHLITPKSHEDWPKQSKTSVAHKLAERVAQHMAAAK